MPSLKSKSVKGGSFKYADMFQTSLSPCTQQVKRGGSAPIHTYIDYTQDWHNAGDKPIPYAVDSSAGINEYIFGRTTPDNKFIVASGLVKNKTGIEMTGGKKKKRSTSKSKKSKTTKKTTKSTKRSTKKTTKSTKKTTKKSSKSTKKTLTASLRNKLKALKAKITKLLKK